MRAEIAWCEDCGNTSVDGFNFASAEGGKLECLRCGAVGYFRFVRGSLANRSASVQALMTDERKDRFVHRYVERWNHWESPVSPEDAEEVWDLVGYVLRGDPGQ